MTSSQKKVLWTAAFVIPLLVLWFFLWKQWTVGKHFMQAEMPECPHDWRTFSATDPQRKETWSLTFESGLSVPGRITGVPEYHDCQRLIVDGAYGPLAAVFVNYRLDSLVLFLDSVSKQGPYLEAADKITSAIVAAQIFQQDGPDYSPLGMRVGFNCLFVYFRNQAPEARMLPVGQDQQRCVQPFDPRGSEGTVLPVGINTVSGYKDAHYPAVARWDRDPVTGTSYVGLKCRPVEWCDIGAGTASARYLADATVPDPDNDHVQRIKGWYDEQMLAVPSPTSEDDLDVGPAMGRVFPHPSQVSRSAGSFDKKWVETGRIALAAPSARYKSMLNLDDTAPSVGGGGLNLIEMCYGTFGGCEIPSMGSLPSGTCGFGNAIWSRISPRWWARITAAKDKTVAYRCVIRRDHSDVGIDWVPGTARWRWMARDETVWEECIKGCCEVEVGDS